MKRIVIIALLCSTLLTYSQRTEAEYVFQYIGGLHTIHDRVRNLAGSPYVESEFTYAKLMNYDKDYLMRYDAYRDLMEVKLNDSIYVLPKDVNYSVKFKYPEKLYKLFSYEKDNKTVTSLFVVLKEQKNNSLLLKEIIEATPEKLPKNGFDPYKPPSLNRMKDKLYVGYKNNTAVELPSNKSDVIALFGEKAKEVEAQAKKMKWSFKKNEGLIEIFNYYYSL